MNMLIFKAYYDIVSDISQYNAIYWITIVSEYNYSNFPNPKYPSL